MFLNFKILETNVPVTLKADWPIAFAQPMSLEQCQLKEIKKETLFSELKEFTDDNWSMLSDVIFDRQGKKSERRKFTKIFRRT